MESSRRRFLKLAGISAVGLTTKPVLNAFAGGHGGEEHPKAIVKTGDKALKAKQWAMVIDTRKIHSSEDLEPIIEACHKIHNVPEFENENHSVKWIWEEEYKHAFPDKREGELCIKLKMAKGDGKKYNYTLIISDNGIGFPQGVDYRKCDTLGMLLVNSLVKQLRGVLELDNKRGTTFNINFSRSKK